MDSGHALSFSPAPVHGHATLGGLGDFETTSLYIMQAEVNVVRE
jgi:hypothetical protein